MKDILSSPELTALRNDLIHHALIDSCEPAALLQLFLATHSLCLSNLWLGMAEWNLL